MISKKEKEKEKEKEEETIKIKKKRERGEGAVCARAPVLSLLLLPSNLLHRRH